MKTAKLAFGSGMIVRGAAFPESASADAATRAETGTQSETDPIKVAKPDIIRTS
jgi:hypothetical protein